MLRWSATGRRTRVHRGSPYRAIRPVRRQRPGEVWVHPLHGRLRRVVACVPRVHGVLQYGRGVAQCEDLPRITQSSRVDLVGGDPRDAPVVRAFQQEVPACGDRSGERDAGRSIRRNQRPSREVDGRTCCVVKLYPLVVRVRSGPHPSDFVEHDVEGLRACGTGDRSPYDQRESVEKENIPSRKNGWPER
jgi:hypothetical protein